MWQLFFNALNTSSFRDLLFHKQKKISVTLWLFSDCFELHWNFEANTWIGFLHLLSNNHQFFKNMFTALMLLILQQSYKNSALVKFSSKIKPIATKVDDFETFRRIGSMSVI